MKSIFHLVRRALRYEAPTHPVERKMAKHWIKQRLMVVFPELRNNPKALEQAYHSLGLEPRAGDKGDDTVFEVKFPEGVKEPDPNA